MQFEIVRNTVTIRIYESLPGKVNKSAKVPFQPLSSSSLISLFAERKRFENKKKLRLPNTFYLCKMVNRRILQQIISF